MKILLATGNAHKLGEILDLMNIPGLELIGLSEFPDAPEVEETGVTFEENAALKAREYAAFANMWTLADDSGIEVDALDLAPGVHSARYAGVHGADDANNEKLLADMKGKRDRRGRFRCVLALSSPEGKVETVSGSVEGTIDSRCTGDHGFGYDVLFIPEGHTESFGVLPAEVKRDISHRAAACKKGVEKWGAFFAKS
jgi:XTP/dITP diphosphohydrolase